MTLSINQIFAETKLFYKHFLPFKHKHLLPKSEKSRNKKSKMPDYQIISIIIMFHLSGYINFRIFYEEVVRKQLKKRFPKAVSYSWFIRLRARYILDLEFFLQTKLHNTARCFYIDSTPIKVCNSRRINNHKTFANIASRGHHSMGWFYGFKLHLIINECGELVRYKVTKGNKNDRDGFDLVEGFKGMLCGDKGYLSKEWEKELANREVKLITKKRKNMKKDESLSKIEKFYLRGRGIIETVIGQLKLMRIENSGLRSICGMMINIISTLCAYAIKPIKPTMRPFNEKLIRT